jgi:hypothetical protein
LRKDKRQTWRKAGVRWVGHSWGETIAVTTSSEFITYSGKSGGRATALEREWGGEWHDTVVNGNRRNL